MSDTEEKQARLNIRNQIAQSFANIGADPDEAMVIADLSLTACDKAMNAFFETANLSPDRVTELYVTATGLQVLEEMARAKAEEAMDFLHSTGAHSACCHIDGSKSL